MWGRIAVIVRKEFLQLLRHPRMRLTLFLPPILQLIIFGYAVNMDVDHIRLGWMDGDRTPASRELLSAFTGSGRFFVKALPANEDGVRRLLDTGEVQAVIRVLPGFASDLTRGRNAQIQLLLDGTNSNSATLISSYASAIVSTFSADAAAGQARLQLLTRMTSSAGVLNTRSSHLTAVPRIWFNPDLRSSNYFVPGVMSNILLVITVMLTAMTIVREKELGTIEHLLVTPIRPIELMIGKVIPAAFVGLVDVLLITLAASLIFHIPFRGSPLLLAVCAALFLLTSLGIGLFISTISQTQQQAVMSSFLFAAPTFMLSGFMFPIRNMPLAVQYFTYLNPLRYFLEIVRGIVLKGTGVAVLWPQMLALLVYGVCIVTLAAARFRRRLD